jgi:uncharacterized FlgJ-related protein
MSLFKSIFGKDSSSDDVTSSPLAEFISRPAADRKKVFTKVLKRASESQNAVIERAAKKRQRAS